MRALTPPGVGLMASSPVGAILAVVGAMTTDLLWAVDGGGDIGDPSGNRPANIYAATLIASAGAITAGSSITASSTVTGSGLVSTTDIQVGQGGLFNDSGDEPLLVSGLRTDGAGNISVRLAADVNKATINATHKVVSIGWINNADAYAELAYFEGNGDLVLTGSLNATTLDGTTITATTGFVAGASGLVNDAVGEPLVVNGIRTDGAGNYAVRIAADVNKATINATMRIASFGFINNSDVYTEKAYILGDGDITGTAILASASVGFAGGGYANSDASLAVATGVTSYGIYNTATGAAIGLRSIRADGAGNVSVAIVADVNNATINATHKVLSVGWLNNADSYTETAYFEGNGDLVITGNLTADNVNDASIAVIIDGGGAEIATGIKADVIVPFDCTIASVTMLADQSGSIQVDIWKDTYANYPPTDADSITAAAVPAISGATKDQDSTLTGWTKALTKGDTIRFNVDSVTTIERVLVHLQVTKP